MSVTPGITWKIGRLMLLTGSCLLVNEIRVRLLMFSGKFGGVFTKNKVIICWKALIYQTLSYFIYKISSSFQSYVQQNKIINE
jgi:hypothetical protein